MVENAVEGPQESVEETIAPEMEPLAVLGQKPPEVPLDTSEAKKPKRGRIGHGWLG